MSETKPPAEDHKQRQTLLENERRGWKTGSLVAVLVALVVFALLNFDVWVVVKQNEHHPPHVMPVPVLAVMAGVLLWLFVGFLLRALAVRRLDGKATFDGTVDASDRISQNLVIACSGGGIKSASFCLGALQRMDEEKVYAAAQKLVAVSGGGYAATAFSLAAANKNKNDRIFAMDSQELRRLRSRTNYLADSPRTRFEFGLSIFFGMAITFFLFGCVGFVVMRVLAEYFLATGRTDDARLALFDSGVGLRLPLLLPIVVLMIVFLISVIDRFGSDRDKPRVAPWSVSTASGLWTNLPNSLGGLALAWLILVPGLLLVAIHGQAFVGEGITGVQNGWNSVAALLASGTLVSVLTQSARKGFSAAKPTGTWGVIVSTLRRRVAPIIALFTIAVVLFAFAATVVHRTLNHSDSWFDSNVLLLVVAVFLAVGRILPGNANRWTMHIFYRDRLAWAFLNGSTESTFQDLKSDIGPELILCATANVLDPDIVPTGRGGTPFIFSAKHTGFTDTHLPGGACLLGIDKFSIFGSRPISLASAMAISGAAVSPIAGRDSKTLAPYRLLLALANVRLGVWLPNPYWTAMRPADSTGGANAPEGKAPNEGTAVKRAASVRNRLLQWVHQPSSDRVFEEAFGTPSIAGSYVYLTDGGHYDNLGLVESLRLRPERVIVIDGSGDTEDQFPTLGRAIATARMDLGVEIAVDPTPLIRGDRPHPPTAIIRAWATWPDDHVCAIEYLKCVLPERMTWDLEAYRLAHPTFPAESDTLEQYDEFDFEAYRQLGYLLAGSLSLRLIGSLHHPTSPAETHLG